MLQQILSFIVTLILARLIAPEEYGVIALVTIFIAIANVFVEGGFGVALIQKKDAEEVDFSSTLYVSFFVSLFLYFLIWFSAPYFEVYFGYENFATVFRAMGVKIVVSSLYTVQQAYISRKMKFKLSFFVSSAALGISAVIGIWMAYRNFGVWALVWQQVGAILIVTFILVFVLDWKPKLIFSWKSLKEIFLFGSKMLVSSLIDTIYSNMRNLVIGKKYTTIDLAYYNKADQFPSVVVNSINSSIGKLLLPVMAKEQEDRKKIKEYIRISIRLSSFIMSPLLIGMAICSEDIIQLLLTDSWIGAAPMMSILCIMYMFYPIHTANLQAIIAIGKSDVYMALEIVKKIIGVTFLCVAVFVYDNVMAIALSGLLVSLIAVLINAVPNVWMLGYRIKEQMKDLLTPMVCSGVMGIFVYFIGSMVEGMVARLVVRVIAGMVSYVVISWLFDKEDFMWLINLSRKIVNHKNKLEETRND